MRILMICTEKLPVPPVLGGAIQTYISSILPYVNQFHDMTVLGISDSSLPEQETIQGVHYVRVPGKLFEIYRENVVRYVEANEFDLIHIFNRPRLVLPIRQAAPAAKITLSMHNDMFQPEKIDPEEAAAAIAEVAHIVTVSDYIGNVIRNLYPQASPKLRTIYSGVDSERFLPGNHPNMQKIRHDIRRAHGLENKTVILFAGRLSRNKGVDKLILALPELAKKFQNVALVIVGSNWFSENDMTDYVAYVRALAKRMPVPVVTTGFVAPNEIQNWFAAADLFVCTSQWQEPLARVHYEAMAAGLPIVTTARGGNPEVIFANENGLIVENPEDPSDFANKIAQILSDQSLMRRMGEKGRQLAISIYQWERVASELLEVWEQAEKTEQAAASEEQAAGMTIEPLEEEATEQRNLPIPKADAKENVHSKKNAAASSDKTKKRKAKKESATSMEDHQRTAKQKEAAAERTELAKNAPAPKQPQTGRHIKPFTIASGNQQTLDASPKTHLNRKLAQAKHDTKHFTIASSH
ncbi:MULTISPECIES: glycosyltransferase family 4 protein [Geobacillus]|uniref:Glycosyl transferase family 1 n=1 Tax=Geobacillus thermocatenulatus TaxID=33938 RepID=A0A226Q570_9BACL|nr:MULTISPECIES: glycosyltransferase family 4 protein [Geobacillus]AST00258.1 glycosyl transferase family 1 [Geobacillus thermocatenulatus]KLR72214.1 glycosyl transferase family 1 [Geobacillus sp. T6]OXB86612.1 glycosyl transferase family 1 [Geobacillus thermocatenulatus]RAN30027.1 glycosyl transferase family 1 [Geobacillus sp. A8]